MGKNPVFPLYASDFDMDTATWENDEIGAYLRLLIYEWVNGKLPNDTYKLSKIVRESQKKFIGKWKNLSTKFICDGNGFLINQKMENVRLEQAKYINSQKEKGIKSAQKRWGDRITPVITTVTKRLQPEGNPSSSISSSISKDKKNKDIYSECFLNFWDSYPKKIGKGKAWEEWEKISPAPSDVLLLEMLNKIKSFKQTQQWRKDGGQFIPLPSTWLHQKRWEDEINIMVEIENPWPELGKR